MGFLMCIFDCDLLLMADVVGNDSRNWPDLRWESGIKPNKIFYLQLFLS